MFKKVFAATLAGLFITAPAFANIDEWGADKQAYENSADFKGVKMNGSFFIKGHAKDINGKSYRYYESDFEVKTNFIVDEKTSATLVVEAFDTDWTDRDFVGSNTSTPEGQNRLEVSKATMNHTFDSNTTFYGGIAGNLNTWGTLFGDDARRTYFLQLDQALPFGTLSFKTEKISEGLAAKNAKKSNTTLNKNGQDKDGYLLGLDMKAGAFTIRPAVYHSKDKASNEKTTKYMVSSNGKVGAINIDAEFGFSDYKDESVFGAWIDASTTVAGLSVNASALYSGTEKTRSFYVGDELCPMEILGDDLAINGATLFRVKANKAITEKVSLQASAAYAFNNFDAKYQKEAVAAVAANKNYGSSAAGAAFDNAYEIDAVATYKSSDAVTLSFGVAYIDGKNAKGLAAASQPLTKARTDAYAKIALAF